MRVFSPFHCETIWSILRSIKEEINKAGAKVFIIEKCPVSLTLFQRAWRNKNKSRKAPNWSTISGKFNQ